MGSSDRPPGTASFRLNVLLPPNSHKSMSILVPSGCAPCTESSLFVLGINDASGCDNHSPLVVAQGPSLAHVQARCTCGCSLRLLSTVSRFLSHASRNRHR